MSNTGMSTINVSKDSYAEEGAVFDRKFEQLKTLISRSHHITVFTGAGVSTLSNIPDFRGRHGVYTDPWNGLDVETIISLSFFRKNPQVFYRWAEDVWYHLEDYSPNIVHKTLALMQKKGMLESIYTQNIDMLHHRAGSTNVHEVHGSPIFHHCTKCRSRFDYEQIAPVVRSGQVPLCPKCGGVIKPDIVFYEEPLDSHELECAFRDFSATDLCLVLGSSLLVQPAASFPQIALQSGAQIVIVNAQETYQDKNAALVFRDLEQTFTALDKWLGER